jgi:hypothetical protein
MFARLFATVSLLCVSAPVLAADGGPFAPVPAIGAGAKASGLEMRVVQYDGSTNGRIRIEVRNPTRQPVEFSARGLYFVPGGNPDQAPQRLGAVGPFQVRTEKGLERREKLMIAPGGTSELQLDVYCIDSHRSSPSSGTAFRPAKDRIPDHITGAIDKDAKKATESLGGVADPRAKGVVQSTVWKNRDARWVPLDGEGTQEVGKR